MKTKSRYQILMCRFLPLTARRLWCALITIIGLTAELNVQAASQTWTNAPVDSTWTNINNWVGRAVPGVLGIAGGAQNGDIVTFSNALSGGIGGGGNPILNETSREVNGFIFDSANCGAYVIGYASSNLLWLSATLFPGGSINVTPTVVNPITFNAETHFRLQSSQNGGYNITNNATSAGATLYFDVLWPDSASSRPLTLTLAGSNTGTNTIRHIDDNAGANGSIHLVKAGTGTWILSGANDIPQKTSGGDNVPGSVAVMGGTLEVQDPGSLGAITAVNLSVTNGTLQIDGITLNNAGITLRQGGTILMKGSGTVKGVTMSSAFVGNSATLATTSASDVLTVGDGTVANQMTGGAADSVLHVAGPGTVLLSQPGNYAGKWSVDAGTNQLGVAGALGTGANLNINAGAVFDVTPLGATTYTLDTKGFSANGTGTAVGSTAATIMADPAATVDFVSKPITLTFKPIAATSDSGHPALYCSHGTLSFHGNQITVSNAFGTALGAGTYQLVHQASGSIVSSGAFVTLVNNGGLGTGMIGEIVAVGGDLDLVVTAYTNKVLVWKGGDVTLPSTWDRQTSINWLDVTNATPATFNIYDGVTFNATGSAQPNVNLATTMVPGSVTVDTSANNYTFSGAGQIAGGTSLIKISPGNLLLQTANTYSGGTVISNGTVVVGINDAIPSTGNGDVALYSPGVIDMNGFSDTINALNGNGTVDVTGGGTSTLTIGDNGDSGTFSGVIRNTSGTLGLFKSGNGTETLTASNSYAGPTTIDTGTLRVTNLYALGSNAVTINSGNLDLATSLIVASINGNGGTIVNNSTATTVTNTLIVQGTSTSGSLISGRLALLINGGTTRLNAANTYSGGTIVASGAGLGYGNVGQSGSGGVIASNSATISLASANNPSSAVAASITTVDNATVTFTSGTTGNSWNGQFIGSTNATDIFSGGAMSIGGAYSFSNFLGTVIITNGGVRWFNAVSGGDNTTFIFTNGGGGSTRDPAIVRLGALFGNGFIGNPSVGGVANANYWIGAKGIDSEYSGTIAGSNNIVKTGVGRLTLDGAVVTTNTDSATFTNYIYAPAISYLGSTTVSNGVLALSVPNNLDNSPTITLAASTAVLDASNMGYITNLYDVNYNPYSLLITNGVFELLATTPLGTPQTLAGIGTIKGNGVISSGSINPGVGGANGTLSISNGLVINAGATNLFDLSDDPSGLVKPNDMIKVQGNVGLSGGSIITIGGTPKVGTYVLIKYGGNLTNEGGVVPSGPISNFTLAGGLSQYSRATMVLSNAPGEVDLIVVSLNNLNLTWTGDGVSNLWDVVNSYTWTNGGASIQFYQLDNVTFDDTANPTNDSVFLSGTLLPGAITVNSVTNYILGGNGTIGGVGTLIKKGSGTLILTNGANSYTGGTILSNGVLNVGSDSGGNQNDLALGTGPVTVNSPAELRFGGNTGAVVNHFVTNSITINGGIVKAQDGVQHLTNSSVSLTANGGTFQTVFATKNLVLDSAVSGTGPLTISVPAGFVGGSVVFNNPSNTVSGSVAIATNGVLTLNGSSGLSNSPSIDIQLGGALDTTGRTNRLLTLLSGQTLKGNGTLRGNLTTAAGSTLSPGASAGILGILTVANTTGVTNTATLGGTTIMELNRAVTPNSDRLLTAGTNVFGGTLTVNNIGAALQLNDTFQLFTNAATRGAFAVTNLPSLTSGLGWSNSLAINGRLTVIATVNTNPTTITAVVNGNQLTLNWPFDHTGWHLQIQTNSLSTGLNTNWVTLPGSDLVNSTNMTINPANGAVFYRMVYP